MTQGKANDEERERIENELLPIVGMLPFLERGRTLSPTMYPALVDYIQSLLERRVSEARIMELSDAAKTFTDSSSISYTGQQIHQIINSRIDYARSPETPAEPWRKSKAE